MLADRSKVLNKLLYPAHNNKTVTLAQYQTIVEAGLTQEAHCAGVATSGAVAWQGVQGGLLQLLLAVVGCLVLGFL
jgi:hypothetical protein